MKKSLKLIVLGPLLSTTVMGSVAFAADTIDPAKSKATATFVKEKDDEGNEVEPLRFGPVTAINFGEIMISGDRTTVGALYEESNQFTGKIDAAEKYAPLSVTTVDNRGTGAGWTMSVAMTKQFTAMVEGDEVELDKATLNLEATDFDTTKELDGRLAPTTKHAIVLDDKGIAAPVVSAAAKAEAETTGGEGVGTWTTFFGDRVEGLGTEKEPARNDKVQISIPGDSTKEEAAYTADLTWTLAATPETI